MYPGSTAGSRITGTEADAREERLLERIAIRARVCPDRTALRFLIDSSNQLITLNWGELWQLADCARRLFVSKGLEPGDRVILMLPSSPEYVAALLGAWMGRIVPTTLAPAARFHDTVAAQDEWRGIVEAFDPHLILTNEPLDFAGVEVVEAGLIHSLLNVQVDSVVPALQPVAFDDIAYVQYSSGSTGRPKGLALSWSAIHANITGIADRLELDPSSEVCSWLPLYHDMGLFGMLLSSLHYGCPLTLMDPGQFVANPKLWLKTMGEFRTRITTAPPSAVHYSLELLRRRPMPDLDLSALEILICGAETVPPRLVREFAELMPSYGVSPQVLLPVYGLAEATLAVTIPRPGRVPPVDVIERISLETKGEAIPASSEDCETHELVALGWPLREMQVRILDDEGESLGDRRVGRVMVSGPSLMSGTLEGGHMSLRTGEWLDTGDLGYLADGDLYITGRRKDILIKGGRNYSPDRIEDIACMVDGVQRAAAFGLFDPERMTEKVVVATEVRPVLLKVPEGRDRLRLSVRKMLSSAGYLVDEVVLVSRGELPRTTSGKIRRQACREIYQRGDWSRRYS